MNNTKVFQNTWPLQQLPATLKLSNLEWRFLICADGKMPVDYIQRRLGLTEQERDYVLTRLCGSNLLTEVFLTLEEYAKLTVDLAAAESETLQTLPEYLKAAELAAPAQDKSLPAFSPLPKPSPTVPTVRAMSLRSVIQFILNQNPDPTAGHLATYQVFMGINTQLLKRNGITSLRFQDDRFITDPELQTAISENVEKVLGKPCPEDVFSNQPATGEK
jgi:hypothetical protein